MTDTEKAWIIATVLVSIWLIAAMLLAHLLLRL